GGEGGVLGEGGGGGPGKVNECGKTRPSVLPGEGGWAWWKKRGFGRPPRRGEFLRGRLRLSRTPAIRVGVRQHRCVRSRPPRAPIHSGAPAPQQSLRRTRRFLRH